MNDVKDLTAEESRAAQAARDKLRARVEIGAKRQTAVIAAAMSTTIIDRLVPPTGLVFDAEGGTLRVGFRSRNDVSGLNVHTHALGQMSDVAGITRTYCSRLNAGDQWMKDLLAHNFNVLFTNSEFKSKAEGPKKFMIRSVGSTIRGFLSQNFNRKLGTATMLRAFVEGCAEHSAGPVEAWHTDIKTSVKCVLPYVFEPLPGEFIAFGLTFTNSDFGAGRLGLSETVMRVSSGTVSVLEDRLRRSHIGPAIEGDFELSEELAGEETALIQHTIKEVVGQVFTHDTVKKKLEAIKKAHEKEIPWSTLKGALSQLLTEEELNSMETLLNSADVVDLPPVGTSDGKAMPTAWWASNALSFLAMKVDNPERQADLQSAAGSLMR